MKIKLFLTALLLSFSVFSSQAQDAAENDKFMPKARPIIQQCELKDADDPVITKAAKDIATADNAAKIKIAADLGNTCNKKSTPVLLTLLQEKDTDVRIAAIEALGRLGDEEAVEPLADLRTEPNWKLRFALGPVLAAFPVWKARYSALNFIASTSESEVKLDENDIRARCNTVLALHQLTDVTFSRKSMRFLIGYLDIADEKIHKIALATMQEMPKTRNFQFEIVGELRQANNPHVRKKCAYWIGELKIERGRDTLIDKAANDPDPEVKKEAAAALKKLGKAEN